MATDRFDRTRLGFGLVLMALGSPAAVGLIGLISRRIGRSIGEPALFGIMVLFVLGWIIFGVALRPQDSGQRGVVLALALYLLIGVIWAATYAIINPYNERSDLWTALLARPILIALWPGHIPFVLEWFGLGPQ